MYSVNI